MANNRQTKGSQKVKGSYVTNKGVVKTINGRQQIVMSEPSKKLVEKYLTLTGLRAMRTAVTKEEKAEVWARHGKNRYKTNLDAKPVKVIYHEID